MPPALLRRRTVVALSLLFCSSLLSLSPSRSNDEPELVAGRDYTRGEVIFAFREGLMPSDAQLSPSTGRVGIPRVDSILAECQATRLVKFLPTRNSPWTSPEARRFERTFRVKFSGPNDPKDVASALARETCFDYVIVNRIVEKEYYGLRREEPVGTKFSEQWYFDSSNDKLDIDMPEAWAIERGDSDVVVVINDSGTLVLGFDQTDCNDSEAWQILGDFNHLWLSAEDTNSPGVLKADDIDGTDADGDGVKDNIIGANFAPGVPGAPACELAMWAAVPNDIRLSSDRETPDTWDCFGYWTHGVRVGSIVGRVLLAAPLGVLLK